MTSLLIGCRACSTRGIRACSTREIRACSTRHGKFKQPIRNFLNFPDHLKWKM